MESGASIDVWVVERMLGKGGMGNVYRCHNRDLPKLRAAVKILTIGDEKASRRLQREAAVLKQLDHPGVVKVWDISLLSSPPYMVMDLVDGQRLSEIYRREALNEAAAAGLAMQLADALDYAHQRGIWHRDIKPSNILIQSGGRATLVDFGIALMEGSRPERLPPGTLSYAPPEWLDGEGLDATRWDLYSLGVVIWESLTGKKAFRAARSADAADLRAVVMEKRARGALDPGADFDGRLRDLIRRMTDPEDTAGFPTAAEVRDTLRALLPEGADPTEVLSQSVQSAQAPAAGEEPQQHVAAALGLEVLNDPPSTREGDRTLESPAVARGATAKETTAISKSPPPTPDELFPAGEAFRDDPVTVVKYPVLDQEEAVSVHDVPLPSVGAALSDERDPGHSPWPVVAVAAFLATIGVYGALQWAPPEVPIDNRALVEARVEAERASQIDAAEREAAERALEREAAAKAAAEREAHEANEARRQRGRDRERRAREVQSAPAETPSEPPELEAAAQQAVVEPVAVEQAEEQGAADPTAALNAEEASAAAERRAQRYARAAAERRAAREANAGEAERRRAAELAASEYRKRAAVEAAQEKKELEEREEREREAAERAAVEAAEAAARATALVTFDSSVASARLRSSDGAVYSAGKIPPGTYQVVEVSFVGGPVIYPGWSVSIGDGQTLHYRCDARFETCSR